MAEKESDLYSAKAQNLLALIGDNPYYEYTPMPEDIIQPKRISQQTDIRALFVPNISVYPNPTKGELQVEYNFETLKMEGIELLLETLGYIPDPDCENGTIKIYSNNGQLLELFLLYNFEETRNINISSYPAGIYILEITDCYNNSKSLKITKQ